MRKRILVTLVEKVRESKNWLDERKLRETQLMRKGVYSGEQVS